MRKSPLFGRSGEVDRLRGLLVETAAGVGGCVVLTGSPGIGKTRLLDEVGEVALELGLCLAYGRAAEIDRLGPSTTLLSALRNVRPEALDLVPLRDYGDDRFRYVDRLGVLLEEHAARRPLVFVVDDAHWADEFSALALRVLVTELASSPVRWVLCRRPTRGDGHAHGTIEWLLDNGGVHVVLGRLDDAAVRELCRYTLDAEPDATVLALAGQCLGNPFLLEQLLNPLRSAGQILVRDGTASAVGAELPAGFPAAVSQRLGGLGGQTRDLLRVGSVFGRPFSIHAAAKLLGVPALWLASAADDAVVSGILVERGTDLTFRHDLLRQAIYQSIATPVRAAMHREAAAVLRDEGVPIIDIAEHLLRGGAAGDREVVALLRRAASDAAGQAPATAADFILHALTLLGEHDEQRAALTAEAVGLLASAGRLTEARELGEAALRAGLEPAIQASLLLGLAEALKHAGQNQLAVEYAGRALAGPVIPDAIRAGLHAIAAHGLLYIDRAAEADAAGATADELGRRSGEHAASVFGNAARSVVARMDGRLADALTHAGNAVTRADHERGEALHRHPRIWYGGALAAVDRFDDAGAAFAAGRLEAERLGTAWSQPLWHFYNASLLTAKGWLDDAVAEAEAGLRVAEELTALQLSVPLLGLLAKLATLRAEMPLARSHLRKMQQLRSRGITAAPEDVLWPMALFEQADGRPQLAVRTLAEVYAALPGRLLLLSNDPGCSAELVRIALAAGAPAQAHAVAAAARLLADRNPDVPSLAGAAAHAEGLLHDDVTALRAAVEHYAGSPRPLARAGALEDCAERLYTDDREEAIGLLEAALRTCEASGARRAARRLEQRLRTLGVTQRVRSSGAGPVPGLEGLTEAELQVARLVADGKTNREIAAELQRSPHTVDSHIRHIFAKFGIRSRTALARVLPG